MANHERLFLDNFFTNSVKITVMTEVIIILKCVRFNVSLLIIFIKSILRFISRRKLVGGKRS